MSNLHLVTKTYFDPAYFESGAPVKVCSNDYEVNALVAENLGESLRIVTIKDDIGEDNVLESKPVITEIDVYDVANGEIIITRIDNEKESQSAEEKKAVEPISFRPIYDMVKSFSNQFVEQELLFMENQGITNKKELEAKRADIQQKHENRMLEIKNLLAEMDAKANK